MSNNELTIINENTIKDKISVLRGIPVMLDRDLALIYGYDVKYLNRQVKNNIKKFPEDMMFQLTKEECLRCKFCTLEHIGNGIDKESLRSQIATLETTTKGRGKYSKYLPYAFTEQGIYMLMTVLKGDLATKQSIQLVREFKRLKEIEYGKKGSLIESDNYHLLKHEKRLDIIESNMATKEDVLFLTNEMNKLKDNIKDENNIKDYIFMSNTRYEADELFRKLFSSALTSITIIDNYISIKNLYLLKDVKKGLKISLFTTKKNLIKDKLNEIEYKDFTKDNKDKSISIYDTSESIHDRIIILDYKESTQKVYILGSSIKDTGIKISILYELKYFDINKVLRKIINESKMFWND